LNAASRAKKAASRLKKGFVAVLPGTGAKAPAKKIDGKNLWPLMAGQQNAKSPHEVFF
jgi:hypothetical protein